MNRGVISGKGSVSFPTLLDLVSGPPRLVGVSLSVRQAEPQTDYLPPFVIEVKSARIYLFASVTIM